MKTVPSTDAAIQVEILEHQIRYRRKIRILTALSAKAVGIQIRRIINFCKKYGEDLPKLCQNWGYKGKIWPKYEEMGLSQPLFREKSNIVILIGINFKNCL